SSSACSFVTTGMAIPPGSLISGNPLRPPLFYLPGVHEPIRDGGLIRERASRGAPVPASGRSCSPSAAEFTDEPPHPVGLAPAQERAYLPPRTTCSASRRTRRSSSHWSQGSLIAWSFPGSARTVRSIQRLALVSISTAWPVRPTF